MFPLMFVAIAAGLGTAAAVAPTSIALAVVSAPFGGSFAALAAALYLARRNAAAAARAAAPPDLHDRTDAMVAALRSLEVHDRARETAGRSASGTPRVGRPAAGRNVA
ncbi:hypothetical protein [Methylobacterium sp. Leaf112]|uniref:hypothetical protein n=1 Tax=Methylobacterium sp. Leaf112 TaxID=1736258 RepID=UPI000A4A518C|nr:hypothetical protein [Methylobacterium sp. Leaf112]